MIFRLSIRNSLDELATAQRKVDRFLAAEDAPAEAAYIVRLVLEEIVSNVIRHGYDDAAAHEIGITVTAGVDAIEIAVDDDGRAFDPRAGEELVTPGSLEAAPTGGMGLPLVKAMAGPIEYERVDGRNRTRVRVAT